MGCLIYVVIIVATFLVDIDIGVFSVIGHSFLFLTLLSLVFFDGVPAANHLLHDIGKELYVFLMLGGSALRWDYTAFMGVVLQVLCHIPTDILLSLEALDYWSEQLVLVRLYCLISRSYFYLEPHCLTFFNL